MNSKFCSRTEGGSECLSGRRMGGQPGLKKGG